MRQPRTTIRGWITAGGVVCLSLVISEVVRYRGMSQPDRDVYLFGFNHLVAYGTLLAIPIGALVFVYFLLRPDPNRRRPAALHRETGSDEV